MSTMVLRRGLGRRGMWLTVLRVAALAAGIQAALVFVVAPLTGRFTGDFEDFNAYYGAAQAVLAHHDIYAAFTQQTQNVALSGFDYPPVVAWLVAPIALLPKHTAATLWLLMEVAATVAGTLVIALTLLPRTWSRVELAILAAFLFAPAAYNLWLGQMNPVVFLLLALALRAWVRGDEMSCGALIAGAAMLKLAPVVLLVLFVRRRWWRGLAVAAGVIAVCAGAGLLGFGPHTSAEYIRSVVPVLGRDDGWLYNQSWAGVLNRAAGRSVLTFQPVLPLVHYTALAMSVAGVAAAAWVVRARASSPVRGAEFGAGIVAMLLAGSITWYSHDEHALIALAAATALALVDRRNRRLLLAAVAGAGIGLAVIAPLLISSATMAGIVAVSHTPAWWPLLQASSLPALSLAALLAALLVALRRAGAPVLRAANAPA